VQNSVRSDAQRLKFVRGKVTAAVPQIIARVPQNIDELQSLAVLDAQLTHLRFGPLTEISDVRKTDPRPEFPHTSSDKISVFVELRSRGKRCNARARSSSESLKIEHLSPSDFLEYAPHLGTIAGSQLFKPFQQTGKLLDQCPFCFIPLQRGE
jgi:hypothetical protein